MTRKNGIKELNEKHAAEIRRVLKNQGAQDWQIEGAVAERMLKNYACELCEDIDFSDKEAREFYEAQTNESHRKYINKLRGIK